MNIVGVISPHVESLLNLSALNDRNIYLGPTNITHKQNSHPNDYNKYKNELQSILSAPDYVGVNPKDNSIETEIEDGTGSRHPSWRCGNVTPPIFIRIIGR